jgi:hypothetical protein
MVRRMAGEAKGDKAGTPPDLPGRVLGALESLQRFALMKRCRQNMLNGDVVSMPDEPAQQRAARAHQSGVLLGRYGQRPRREFSASDRPGLCIARSGNPTFADRQITLVASPRNQISQFEFLSFELDEFQAARAKLVLRSVASTARSARSA